MHKSLGIPAEGLNGHVATDWLFARKDWQVGEHVFGRWCSSIMMKK